MHSSESAFVRQYRRVDTLGSVETADPHTLVSMLYDGFSEAVTNAKGAILRGDIAGKGRAVVRGIDILESLRISLDTERGGNLAGNLARLYTYMSERLTDANLSNDVEALEEVIGLNDTLRGAWESIGERSRGDGG